VEEEEKEVVWRAGSSNGWLKKALIELV